jgi:hypothetical protein
LNHLDISADSFSVNPMVTWGVHLATVNAIRKNYEDARADLGLEGLFVGIRKNVKTFHMPAIIVKATPMVIERSGLSNEWVEPLTPEEIAALPPEKRGTAFEWSGKHEETLRCKGIIKLELHAKSLLQLWTLQDFLIQQYHFREIYGDSFFDMTGRQDYVRIGLGPGELIFTEEHAEQPAYTAEAAHEALSSNASFAFMSEHVIKHEVGRVTGVVIEETQLNIWTPAEEE